MLLVTLEDGQLHADLSEAVAKLCEDLSTHAAKYFRTATGSISLDLKFHVEQNGVVKIEASTNSKRPVAPRTGSLMWLDEDHRLTQKNPRQQELPLRDVSAPQQVDVGDETPREVRNV